MIKIQQGTQRDDSESLCKSCSFSHVWTDNRGDHVRCHESYSTTIRGKVVECNTYLHKNLPSRHDLEKIAWTITTDKSGKIVGFKAPKKEND